MKINLTKAKIKRLRPKGQDYTVWDARTPHLGIRIRRNGSMRYIYVAKRDGKVYKVTLGDVKTMSLDVARGQAEELNRGEVMVVKPEPVQCFAEFVRENWLETCTDHLKPSSRKYYERCIERYLIPAFGDIPLDALSRSHILNWFDRYSRKAPGGANKVLSALRVILSHAVTCEIIPRNPAKGIKPNPRNKMTRFLSEDERERLLSVLSECQDIPQVVIDIVLMLLFTGCRRQEILQLRHEEIGDGVINLMDSKTGPRKVWVSPEAQEIIDRQPTRSGYVFARPGNSDRCYRNIGRHWDEIRKRAGIEGVRLHDLRHSFASHAVRMGVSLPVLKELLGHSTIKMTMRYVHLSDAYIEEAAERIGKQILKLIEGVFLNQYHHLN
jgi:integrase